MRCYRALSLTIHRNNYLSMLEASDQTELVRGDVVVQAWGCGHVWDLLLRLGPEGTVSLPAKVVVCWGGSMLPRK